MAPQQELKYTGLPTLIKSTMMTTRRKVRLGKSGHKRKKIFLRVNQAKFTKFNHYYSRRLICYAHPRRIKAQVQQLEKITSVPSVPNERQKKPQVSMV